MTARNKENATIGFVYLGLRTKYRMAQEVELVLRILAQTRLGSYHLFDHFLVAIGQVENVEGINRFAEWEWKGGTIPFENLIPQP